ncbi:AI-2E family transporter [Mangrovimonas sp. ST2L15]|uniref:AI-2E family transporter n=1 Tax=Mangrovimonas sp. ST2L15 TaxID=1645916 RepID=UPI0006B457D7|nr:AI-2E family transporter [Mangrovimonas sp. ST2L15]
MNKSTLTIFIRIALVSLLLIWTFKLLSPFIGVLAWAVILAVSIYPFYKKRIEGSKLKSFIFSIVVIAIMAVPSYMVFSSAIESTTEVLKDLKAGTFEISPPSEKVKTLPLFGEKLYREWHQLSIDTKEYAIDHREYLLEKGKNIFGSLLGLMGTLLLFIVSFIIAVVFMSNADSSYGTALKFAKKVIGKDGEDFVIISRNTIRSVVKGILLVAIIQALLSFIGLKIAGIPLAGLFTLLVLFCAIIQVPVTLAVIPPIALAFSLMDNTTHAIIFTIYIVVVSLLDNFLKPIMLSKGLKTPTVIIFLGAIGGVMLHGIIGLFVGTVVLAIMHQIYTSWVNSSDDV